MQEFGCSAPARRCQDEKQRGFARAGGSDGSPLSDIDWQRFVFEPEAGWVDRLTALARRRFCDDVIADEAFDFALGELAAGDWRRLRTFSGRSQPGTFLIAIFRRLLEDFARRRFGRSRPPRWVQLRGEWWMRLYRHLCLERLAPEAVVVQVSQRPGEPRSEADVREAIGTLKARIPDCGQQVSEVSLELAPEAAGPVDGGNPEPEAAPDREVLSQILLAVAYLLGAPDAPVEPSVSELARGAELSGRLASNLDGFARSLAFDAEDRLMLRLLYHDGLGFAAAGRRIGLPEHRVRRRHEAALARIRRALEAAGISTATLGDLLDGA
jgi:DNA-directed RNA polymerase specialized sigma24 family protein